jgi:hypothetical protein
MAVLLGVKLGSEKTVELGVRCVGEPVRRYLIQDSSDVAHRCLSVKRESRKTASLREQCYTSALIQEWPLTSSYKREELIKAF